ncbi:type IV pilus biogenesis protein PilP [Pseudomonas sp. CCM 7893]|uniref:Type IV pilus biogenesis protein PilP n=1 Tax=Pseudomonas spelaei TaxID=1055469 RepID=A0A6I3WL32_9PSED|nr:type IV pilus biogenesis protein PilP [Pseudomonas spelaei]MUF07949.1 type IV pilus biogenesis protein PilP [Pseudomonas spelaei]
MRNKRLWILCSFIVFGTPLSWANETSPTGVNVGELAIVQSQTILFNAKAERAKAERSISGEDLRVTTQTSPALFGQGSFQPSTSAAVRNADAQSELPVVKAVFGSAKRLRATLLYSGGVEVDADATSRELPGGYRVATLTVDNVTLERSGKRYPLGFSNIPPVSSEIVNPSSTPSAPMLPGMIPGQR